MIYRRRVSTSDKNLFNHRCVGQKGRGGLYSLAGGGHGRYSGWCRPIPLWLWYVAMAYNGAWNSSRHSKAKNGGEKNQVLTPTPFTFLPLLQTKHPPHSSSPPLHSNDHHFFTSMRERSSEEQQIRLVPHSFLCCKPGPLTDQYTGCNTRLEDIFLENREDNRCGRAKGWVECMVDLEPELEK